jgi:hypothetical protein
MPGSDAVIAALLAGSVAGGLVLLVVAVRGTVVDPTRPPGRLTRWWARQRSPLLMLRVAVAVVVAVVVGVVTRWPVAAIGVGTFVAFYPAFVGGSKLELRQIERLDAVVSWTEALRDTTAAHAGLEQAIAATADKVRHRSGCVPVAHPAARSQCQGDEEMADHRTAAEQRVVRSGCPPGDPRSPRRGRLRRDSAVPASTSMSGAWPPCVGRRG